MNTMRHCADHYLFRWLAFSQVNQMEMFIVQEYFPWDITREILKFQGPHPLAELLLEAWDESPFYPRHQFWYWHLNILQVVGEGYSGHEQIEADYDEFIDEYVMYMESDD